jgi:hypothetical protein
MPTKKKPNYTVLKRHRRAREKMRSLHEEHQTLIKMNDIATQQLIKLKEGYRKEIQKLKEQHENDMSRTKEEREEELSMPGVEGQVKMETANEKIVNKIVEQFDRVSGQGNV